MVEKESHTDLAKKLDGVAKQITIGAIYLHYKEQHSYRVLNLVIAEADQQPYVVYQAQYGDRITFTRSAESWLQEVDWQGKKVQRFTSAPPTLK